MHKVWKIALCVVLLSCSGLALGQWHKNGFVSLDSEWSRSDYGFSAMLLLSDQPDFVLRSWAKPADGIPVHRNADKITRGVPIVAFVFFSGCEAGDNGLCNATADFTILRPDGSVYESFNGRDLWKDKPAPPYGTLRLSAEYVGVVIEPEDPLGEYQVLVSVHDLNSGANLELQKSFIAAENRE